MHEYPITQQIIRTAEKHAKAHDASRVTSIALVVGEYSGYIGDSIQMYFDVISKDTICEGARLAIEPVAPKLRCESCGALFTRKPFEFACPSCGGEGRPTEIGREFYIKEITVE